MAIQASSQFSILCTLASEIFFSNLLEVKISYDRASQ